MITALSKNRLKQIIKLHHKKHRDREKQFLISGLRAVKEVLKSPASCLEILVDSANQDIIFELNPRDINHIAQYTLETKDFNSIVDEKNPQGICVIVKKPEYTDPTAIKGRNILFLDRINDPGNLGTIIRSACWFGIDALLLSPQSSDPYQLKVTRSSAGNMLNIPVYEEIDMAQLKKLKKVGYTFIGTDVGQGEGLSQMDLPAKRLFLLGSEAHGLDKELRDICDKVCYIQSFGKGESLNLANAAAIIMYQLRVADSQR